MIKITFEVSEDFVRENAKSEKFLEGEEKGNALKAIKALAEILTLARMEKLIDEGKTEFVVTPDKLDDKSKIVYNGTIGQICALAVFSEHDNKGESEDVKE